jgi:hypothetical protein
MSNALTMRSRSTPCFAKDGDMDRYSIRVTNARPNPALLARTRS